MALMHESAWRGKIFVGGWTANIDAFTETRWVTVRGDITPYPF
jgi:hypothetical protein